MKFLLYLFSFALLFNNLFSQIKDSDLKKLADFLAGYYSSEEQAKADTNFFHIKLKILPIWKERADAYWFYVEQAAAETENKPYRQRIYRITRFNDSLFESAVFTFNDPLRFAGDEKLFETTMTPDSLIKRDGCSVYLYKVNENLFYGSTREKDCPSEIRKAKYATSVIELYENKFISWDRGFDENDKQVWGSKKGGYIFDKIKRIEN